MMQKILPWGVTYETSNYAKRTAGLTKLGKKPKSMFFAPWDLNVRNPKMLTTLLQTLSKQREALVTQTPQIPKITLQRVRVA